MMYDRERAQQPASGSPNLAEQHALQEPLHESPRPTGGQAPGTDDAARASGPALLARGERDKLTVRLQQALNTFVESPRQAVEEADGIFDEAVTRLTEALTERRRVLRTGWQGAGQGTEVQTEELRQALQQYRETAERLLRM